jgi:hypothetical protein
MRIAKLVITLPKQHRRWIDERARARGVTRSRLLQELVGKAQDEEAEEARVRQAIDEFLALRLPPGGPSGTEMIRELRDTR